MKQSESLAALAAALNKFKSEHPAVALDETVEVKDRTGKYLYSYNFASASGIKTDIEPFLTRNGLVVSQIPDEGNKLITMLIHVSGEFMSGCMDLSELNTYDQNGVRQNSGPQDYGKILSFAKRYAYCAILGLIGDSTSSEKPKSKPSAEGQQMPPNDGAGQQSASGQLPWLNKTDTKGNIFPQWTEAIKEMTEGPGDINFLLAKYRINKDNRNDLLNIKRNYVSVEKLTYMTDEVRKKINNSQSVSELQCVWDSYKALQTNQDFKDAVNMKKTILVAPKSPELSLN